MKTLKNFKIATMIVAIAMVTSFSISKTMATEPANKAPTMTIVEIASSDARFSILVEAVVKADLVAALSAKGPYTVFAPTNDAFNQLFETLGVSGINDLSRDQLTPILLYHVVSGKVMAENVTTGKVPTLNESASLDVKVSKKGVKIDKSADVIITDIEATNGVVHAINAVLLPTDKDSASAGGSCN